MFFTSLASVEVGDCAGVITLPVGFGTCEAVMAKCRDAVSSSYVAGVELSLLGPAKTLPALGAASMLALRDLPSGYQPGFQLVGLPQPPRRFDIKLAKGWICCVHNGEEVG
jgi:hypothetical protein